MTIGIFQSALLLAANSGDSLAVLTVTFSDQSERFDLVTVIGAGLAAVALTAAMLLLSTRTVAVQYLGTSSKETSALANDLCWLSRFVGFAD